MTEKQQPLVRGLGNAIRAQRSSLQDIDPTTLNKTLVKSGLWKKATLERIAAAANTDDDEAENEILQQLKAAVGEVVDRHWQDLVRSASATVVSASESDAADSANDDDARREATNARKLLAMHDATMKQARFLLIEERARVYVHGQRIDSLVNSIATLGVSHAKEVEQHRTRYRKLQDAFEEFQDEADRLLEALDRENLRLRGAENAALG